MSTVLRERKSLKPVQVTGRFLVRPITPCELLKEGSPGVLAIDGTPYLCTILGELPKDGEPRVDGFKLTKSDGSCYDIDCSTGWGGWSCDCPDGTYRSERPGGCKHIAALRQAEGGAA